jgi:hypothetical protein
MADDVYLHGTITDEDLTKLEKLVGYPNPTLGGGRNSDRPHWGDYLIGALELDYQNHVKMPGFYGENEWGAWDCMQRLHWDPAFAQAIGNPTTYDYGTMRIAWVGHYLTNFAGDDGWLRRFRCELREHGLPPLPTAPQNVQALAPEPVTEVDQ